MSALRITITAEPVLPFAVWYGRGERQSPLAFVYTGYYNYDSGSLLIEGTGGRYWSRTAGSGTGAYGLYFNSSSVNPQYNYYRGYGYALRCVGRGRGERYNIKFIPATAREAWSREEGFLAHNKIPNLCSVFYYGWAYET